MFTGKLRYKGFTFQAPFLLSARTNRRLLSKTATSQLHGEGKAGRGELGEQSLTAAHGWAGAIAEQVLPPESQPRSHPGPAAIPAPQLPTVPSCAAPSSLGHRRLRDIAGTPAALKAASEH